LVEQRGQYFINMSINYTFKNQWTCERSITYFWEAA